jgi:hypothetical protein
MLNTFSSLVSLLSPFSSLVMQTPTFLTKLSDESIIFIIDVGKNKYHKIHKNSITQIDVYVSKR